MLPLAPARSLNMLTLCTLVHFNSDGEQHVNLYSPTHVFKITIYLLIRVQILLLYNTSKIYLVGITQKCVVL